MYSQKWGSTGSSFIIVVPRWLDSGSMTFLSSRQSLLSLNALTGVTNWQFPSAGQIGPVYSSPVVAQGMVIFGSDDFNVYAVSASTGQLVWSFLTRAMVRSSSAVRGGMVAVGSDDGNLYLLDVNTGALIRSVATGGPIQSSPDFSGSGTVYIGSNDTNVYAINSANGKILWHTATGGAVVASPVSTPQGSMVIVGSLGGGLYSLSASNGHIIWQDGTLGKIVSSATLGEGVIKNLGAPFVGMAYVSSLKGAVYGIFYDTGAVNWTLKTAGPVSAAPTIIYTKVYFGDSTGAIYEVGSLKYGTSVNAFDQADHVQRSFAAGSVITFGANTAWGKYGIQSEVNLTVAPAGGTQPLLSNVTMTFLPAQNVNYNFYYKWNTAGLNLQPGKYRALVSIADAHSKVDSMNPRPTGFVDFRITFTIT